MSGFGAFSWRRSSEALEPHASALIRAAVDPIHGSGGHIRRTRSLPALACPITIATDKEEGKRVNNLQVTSLLFTSPAKAFSELKQKPVFALPMWLILIGTVAVAAWYYSKVDITWFTDQMVATSKLPDAQRQQMAATITRPVLLWSSVIIAPIVLLAVVAIAALYFKMAGSVTNVRYSFKHWFAFNWWAASPQIIACIASLLILALSSTTQIYPSALQPLSLNELVFHRTMGSPGYNLLSALGVVQVATAWLTYVGVRTWSGRSVLFSLVFALLPVVLIYGVWALVAFR
jgi:hypothetical protein